MVSGQGEGFFINNPNEPINENLSAHRTLFFVSLAVLFASSTWLSGTAATPALQLAWNLSDAQSAWLTISVQLGFIAGTFLYALLNLADVFNARQVFFISALLGAAFNLGFALLSDGLSLALVFRFLTGATLAGVYPVAMKIVVSWFQSGLGWRLGVMVGALTMGTASPYLIQYVGASTHWRALVTAASVAAVLGALLMLIFVKNGPFIAQKAAFNAKMMLKIFAHKAFRLTAFGYFGHMWELYAFWSLIVLYLESSIQQGWPQWRPLLPLMIFLIIGMGALGCVLGGWVSRRLGERKVALISLLISAAMCAVSGFAFHWPPVFLLPYLLIWGFFVISDSPQFSALAARFAPPEYTGTALTVQNGIGFAMTVVSIQLLPWLATWVQWQWAFTFLIIGPLVGSFSMHKLADVTGERLG